MKLQHADHYPLPVAEMFRIFTTRDFYEARYSAGDSRYEFVEFGPRAGQFIVDVKQHVRLRAGASLPAFAHRFVRDENVLRTVLRWQLAEGAERRGSHSFHIDGVPVTVEGTMSLAPEGAGCVNRIELQVKCSIPLIGGQIARLLGERAERTLVRNYESTCGYLRTAGLVGA